MAFIYCIKHKETGRAYIGQTVQPFENRIKQHCCGETEIDKAIKYFGLGAFDYWVVEECKPEELDEKEIYYIAKYDTYYNGYNNTLGGRKAGQNKYDDIIDNIRKDYINGTSMSDLNIKYKISNYSIRYFVKDLQRQEEIEIKHTNDAKMVIGYTKDWQRIGIFESIKDALRFVNNQRATENKPIVDERNFYRTIKTACAKNGIASGYRWQYAEDIFYDGKQFNSSIDKHNYIQGLKCKCIDNIWFTVRNDNVRKSRNIIDLNTVKSLANTYTNREVAELLGFNVGSINRFARKYNIIFKDDDKKINENAINKDIFNKIQLGYTYKQLADIYGISHDAVRVRYNRYLAKHGIIKEDNRIINGVICIENGLVFNSLTEAARYLKNDTALTNYDLRGCAYKISLAARNNTIYKGYHWKPIDKQ
jgi:Mor family transcriptional regulator